MSREISRRKLLMFGGTLWGGAALASQFPVIAKAASGNRAARQFSSLTAEQALTVEAIAARILPTTDTPGAREAGALWFIDAALAADLQDALPLLQSGIAELTAASGDVSFDQLSESRQDQLLRERERGEFFDLLRFLTIAGTFTMSEYGGNRNNAGWQILGLTEQHHWQAPFGYYDRDRHGEHEA